MTHSLEGKAKGARWAFEFQHSTELTYTITSLKKQGESSLESYLTNHFIKELDMVIYVLKKYDNILTELESRHPTLALTMLFKIKYFLDPNKRSLY